MALPAQPQTLPAWRTIRAELRQSVGDSMYEIWLAPLELKAWDGELLLLEAPADMRGWVSERFGRLLERCAKHVLGDGVHVALTSGDGRAPVSPLGASEDATLRQPDAATVTSMTFNPRHTFEQFIIGEGNRLAHAAALAVAELPGQAYNPLCLHAPPGLGKTHLLHAIGNYVLAYGGGATVRYTTAEVFTNDFMAALGSKSLQPFKRAYRDADVLLIDDVQFLASKTRTSEEFFHTFDALYESGRQLVISCDRLPRSIRDIEARLRERFEAGLVAEMRPPDRATRTAILRKRAALDQIQIGDPAVLELIAERVTTNVRALESVLIKLVASHSLKRRPIDLKFATEVLDESHPARESRTPTVADVQATVASHFSISVAELVSASRASRVAWPRQMAIHLARQLTPSSLEAIGEAFGGRNHATVIHACKRVAQRLADDGGVAGELEALSTEVRGLKADRDC